MNLSEKQTSKMLPKRAPLRSGSQFTSLPQAQEARGMDSVKPKIPSNPDQDFLDIRESLHNLEKGTPKGKNIEIDGFLSSSIIAAAGVLATGNPYGDISADFYNQVKEEIKRFGKETTGQPTPAQMTIFLRCIANATLVERLHGSAKSIDHLKNSIISNLTALAETDNESNLITIYTNLLSEWESLHAKMTEEVTHRDSTAMLNKIKQVLRYPTWKELVDTTYTLVAKALLTSQNAQDVLQAELLAQLKALINLQVGRDLLSDGTPNPGSALEQALQTFLTQINAEFN